MGPCYHGLADPFVKLALPHTFCRAPDYYNTLRITRSSCQVEAVKTQSFRISFQDQLISEKRDKLFENKNWDRKNTILSIWFEKLYKMLRSGIALATFRIISQTFDW